MEVTQGTYKVPNMAHYGSIWPIMALYLAPSGLLLAIWAPRPGLGRVPGGGGELAGTVPASCPTPQGSAVPV